MSFPARTFSFVRCRRAFSQPPPALVDASGGLLTITGNISPPTL
nr:MAG TPA: hypothetical protein [Caudoviricetes sp.]